MTQARANWINPPRWARSLPRQFPPPIGGVMQLSLIGTPAPPRWLAPIWARSRIAFQRTDVLAAHTHRPSHQLESMVSRQRPVAPLALTPRARRT